MYVYIIYIYIYYMYVYVYDNTTRHDTTMERRPRRAVSVRDFRRGYGINDARDVNECGNAGAR